MKRFLMLLNTVALSLMATNCTSPTKNSGEKIDPSWSSSMRSMAANLEELMPYVFSREEFNDPKNKPKIEKMIKNFSKGVSQVPKHTGEILLGKDPIVQYSVARLQANSNQALNAFSEGQIEYSRNVLRENVGLCFSCHSTQNFGPQNNFSVTTLSNKFRLYPSERADFYTATRQFDKAQGILENTVKSPAAMLDDPHEQLRALRKYLFLQVRVKNDPGPAIVLLNSYLTWDRLPFFMATDARAWLESLKNWQYEKKNQSASVARAHELMKKAELRQIQGYQSGLVDYLRASSILHESLRAAHDAKDKAKIYGLLGQSYETLSEMGLWDLPEVYYEACIRTLPKSSEAKQCYKDFERSVILGFSGSGGIFIPQSERELLHELKTLAGF